MNHKDYIRFLKAAILETHGCRAEYVETVPVLETFQGQTVWDGQVVVFDIQGHPQAKQCYAWGWYPDVGDTQAVAVLALPPIDSPQRAVQAYIVSESKRVNADKETKDGPTRKASE